ncbi:VWA domain-containing protein, partial [Arcobacter sp. YIC-80]|uniref:VWA domain-containing protein n=1 Tax=Arcobacter sp. YIC-80 TaxID=3376683 RepID=UPI00384E51F5
NEVNVPAGESVNVQLTWSGAAAGGADTSTLPSNIDVTGGSTATFKVDAKDDYLNEGTEALVVTVTGVTDTDSNFENVEASSTNNVATSAITDTDTLSFNIDNGLVDEDGLLGTSDQDNYDPDEKEITGSLGLNAQDINDAIYEFNSYGQTTSITSKGENINLILSNGNKMIKGMAGTREVFEIELNNDGTYRFKLLDVVDHPDFTSEDLISSLSFNVKAFHEGEVAYSQIKIDIADDIPTANNVIIDADSQYKDTTTNIVIAIDNSGSMGSGPGSKMELAKEAAIKLIERYEQMGDVNVKIVSFNAQANASQWYTSSTSAKNAIAALTAGGATNYEDTLRDTMDTYDTASDPTPSSDQDIFYMLSDGNATAGDANGSDNVSGLIPEWKTFAEANFDDVYSIGIGTNVDLDGNDRGSLDQIADVSNGHDTFVIENVNDLTDEMLATIVNINGILVINSGGNELDFSFGADGPADGSGPKLDGGKISFSWGDGDLSDGVGIIVNNNDGTGPNLQWNVYNNGKVLLGKDANTGEILVKLEANNVNSANPTYEVTQFVPNSGITKLEVPFHVVDGDGDGATGGLSIDIDSDFSAYVKLTGDSSVTEATGAQLVHNLELVDQNGDPIELRAGQKVTVELEYTNDSTEAEDFSNTKPIFVEIVGTVSGNNQAQIVNTILDDLDKEGNEGYTLSIKNITTNVNGLGTVKVHETNGVKDSVTGTILDDSDVVTASISGNSSVTEGNKSSYTIELKDESDNPVVAKEDMVVTLEYTYVDTATNQDISEVVTVTIPANSNKVDFDIQTISDTLFEGNETFKVSILSITNTESFEQFNINNTPISTEIIDDDSFTMSVDRALVDEDALVGTTDNDAYNTVKVFTGSYSFNTNLDVDVSFKEGQTTSLTSKGENIVLQVSADKNTLIGMAGTREIFEITLDEVNNEYTVTLKDVIDHSDTTSEDLETLAIQLEGSTVIGNVETTLNVDIADDIVTIDNTNSEEVTLDNSQFTNMIINGSFENVTGFKTSGSDAFVENKDLASNEWIGLQSMEGWELMSSTSMRMEPHDQDHASLGADDGENYMDLGETNYRDSDIENTHIGQIISGAKDGVTYDLSFAFKDKAFTQANEAESGKMQVIWNGEVIATIDGDNSSWETMNLQVEGGSGDGSNRLEFKEIGEGNDNWGMAIDDIQMTASSITHTGSLSDNSGLDINFGADGKGSYELGSKSGWTLNATKDTLIKDDSSVSISIDKSTGEYTITQTGSLPTGGINIPVVVTDGDGDSATTDITLNVETQTPSLPDSITVKIIDSDTVLEGEYLAHRVKLYDDNGNEVAVPEGEYVEVTLQYTPATTNGAIEGTDYSSQNTVRIYGGTSGTYVFNKALEDNVFEGSESYTVSVSNVTASNTTLENKLTVSSDSVTGTIQESNTPPEAQDRHIELDFTPKVVSETELLKESFETQAGPGDNNQSGWFVDYGTNGDGIYIGDNGTEWTLEDTGLEIHTDDRYNSSASSGQHYAELDAFENVSMKTTVDLGVNNTFVLTFDYKPRLGAEDSSDAKISFGGIDLLVETDENGNVTFTGDDNVSYTVSKNSEDWYEVEATFTNLSGTEAELSFAGQGTSDARGAYLDNITLVGQEVESNLISDGKEFTLKDFVSDIEDDSTSTIVKVKITSLPEDGVLTVNGNPVQVGDIYDET